MIQNNVGTAQLAPGSVEQTGKGQRFSTTAILLLCLVGLVLFVLFSLNVLARETGANIASNLPRTHFLTLPGNWLPTDLGISSNSNESRGISGNSESLLLTAVECIIYGLAALALYRRVYTTSTSTTRLVWLGAIIAGLLFVFAPGILSHDIFVYAGYGRIIAAHHANPYFVTLETFPHDPLNSLDEWRGALSAYGPLWLVVCALSAFFSGAQPLYYVIGFRLLGFACHLLNIWLVGATLRTMGRSPRAVTLGTLLYAWNPMVLFESCLGGHNDIFMLTFMLLGIWLSARGEQRGFSAPRYYLPPAIAFTLAALVKFTSFPLIFFFLVLLVRKVLFPQVSDTPGEKSTSVPRWRPALLALGLTIFSSGFIAYVFYAPFWLKHSVTEIANSFSTPPSARFAENSILRAITELVRDHGMPPQHTLSYTLAYMFSHHPIWNDINAAVVAIGMISGAICLWRQPTTRTIVLAALATLGAILIVTPWFFPWYVIWVVGLAAVALPVMQERVARALVAFALTLSASTFFIYYYNVHPPLGTWTGFGYLFTMIPVLLAFLVFFFVGGRSAHQPVKQEEQS